MLAAPRDVAQIYDPDEWWVERRLIARKLLDINQPRRRPIRIVRDAAPPNKENYRVEHEFTAGWIALALPQGSRHRRPALRPHRHRHLQPDRAGARRLLARPRRRSDEQAAGGARPLRAGGPLQHRLLRPARAREARPARDCAGVFPGAGGGEARRARAQRGRARRRNPLRHQRARSRRPDRGGPRRARFGHRRCWRRSPS